jgi:hypothetical protein
VTDGRRNAAGTAGSRACRPLDLVVDYGEVTSTGVGNDMHLLLPALQVIQLLPGSGFPPVFFPSWIVPLELLLGQASGETATMKVRQFVVTLKLSPFMCCRLDHLSYFYVLVQIGTCAMNQICKYSEEFEIKNYRAILFSI